MVIGDEEAQRILQKLMENLGEASGVLHGLSDYLEYMEDRGQRVIRKLLRGAIIITIGFVIALAITGVAINRANNEADNAHDQAERAEVAIQKNRLAIRVGCTLLSNAILDASIPPPSTQKLVKEILEGMTAEEVQNFTALVKQEKEEGVGVQPPDCDEVARHPERVIEQPDSP